MTITMAVQERDNMIKMFIDNEEVVSSKEFAIVEEMLKTSSTVLNNCYPKSWEVNHDYASNFYYPKDYSKCKILKDDELIFCGIVKNSGNISLRPTDPKYCSLQILDFKTFLSEGETLDFVISNKTINEAIQMVISAVSEYGFVLGNVDIFGGDDVIGTYSTLNKTAYDVLQYLAEITNSRWTTRLVDENTVAIDFYDPTLMPRGANLEYDTNFFEDNNIIDLTFNYGTRDYRNKQVILSDEVYASIDYVESVTSDGYNKTFYTQEKIGTIKSINIGGTDVPVATKTEKEIGIFAYFYYTPGENVIESDETTPTYLAGTKITITYVPLVNGRQIVYNNDEIDRVANQTGRKGIIARYESRNDVYSSDELEKIGETYIRYKGSAEITLTLTTKDVDLYNVGQIVYFESPINDLAQDYMVKKKETNIIATGDFNNIWYTYELTSSFNSESAINYFDNQKAKNKGNIGAGESITRNIDIDNSTNIIFDNLDVEEIEITGDNALNSVLNSPFIN